MHLVCIFLIFANTVHLLKQSSTHNSGYRYQIMKEETSRSYFKLIAIFFDKVSRRRKKIFDLLIKIQNNVLRGYEL